ncbi:MAG: CBS domain-containing protein [Actinomycetota bacterium]
MRVKDIMATPVVTVTPNQALKEVAALLVERGISAVPVVDQNDQLVGIVSERDLIPLETTPEPRSRILPVKGRRHVPTTVAEVMTPDVVTLPESADAAEAARLMLDRGVKRIPIVKGPRVVGIVSRRDLLRVLARTDREIRAEIEELLDDEILMLGRFRAQVANGVVTLSGPADERSRRLAEVLARSVPGVLAVRFD